MEEGVEKMQETEVGGERMYILAFIMSILGISEKAQWVEVLAAKPKDLSSVPEPQVEVEN